MLDLSAESDEYERTQPDTRTQDGGLDQRRALRRERCLDAVIETIRAVGADATMAELAAGAGVSKPVLYTHFGDRLGLTTAVVARLAEISASERRIGIGDDGPPDLAELFDSFVQFVEQDPQIYRWVLRCTPDHSELLRQLVPATIQGKQLHMLVQAASSAKPETAQLTSIAIAGFAVAAANLWLDRHSVSREDLVAHLSRFVANGLDRQPHP